MRTYVAVDGGMTDNIRPMLYDSRYEAMLASKADVPASQVEVTVAGKHCESGDVLVRDVEIAPPELGDILVTPGTGAYGYVMANNYNMQPRPAVVMVGDGEAHLIIERETWDDVVRLQRPLAARHGRLARGSRGPQRRASEREEPSGTGRDRAGRLRHRRVGRGTTAARRRRRDPSRHGQGRRPAHRLRDSAPSAPSWCRPASG